jgi:PAS domain S-box-containing protein
MKSGEKAQQDGAASEHDVHLDDALESHAAAGMIPLDQMNAAKTRRAEQGAAMLNAVPTQIALLDPDGVIMNVNEAWEQFGSANALDDPDSCMGDNYLHICDGAKGEYSEEASAAAAGIRSVLDKSAPHFALEYPCHSPGEQRWFRLVATPLDQEERASAVVMHINITDRKLAEIQLSARESLLSETKEELRLILGSIAEGVHRIDLDGRILFENAAGVALFGWSEGEMLGQKAHELIHHHRADGSKNPIEECPLHRTLQDGKTRMVNEEVFFRKDGSSFPVEYTCSPVKDETGRLAGAVVSFRDISERKRSEERLAMLEFAQDHLHEAMYLLDSNARFLHVNEGACRSLGYSREELLTMRVFDIDPEFTESQWQDHWEFIIKNGSSNFESMCRRKDHRVFPVEVNANYFEWEGRGYDIALVRNMTERKEVEMHLAEQAALLDEASDAIMVRDLDGRVLYWNRGAEAVYGWSGDEILGKSVADFLYGEPEPQPACTEKTLESGDWSGEMQHLTKQGKTVTVLARCTLLRDNQGKPKSILAIYTDVTERKKLEQQFLRSQRMESIGTLAGGIAHDLNNILAPILMAAEVLKDDVHTVDGMATLDTLKRSAERGAALIRQVLGFARGVEGKRIQVNPVHIAREVQKIAQDTFPRNIVFSFEAADDLWSVNADPTQLHQVLMNLYVNARDAMPSGGKLSITLSNLFADESLSQMNAQGKPGPYVVLEVEDTGCGMSKEIQEKVFEPFFTTKDIGKGTGLGLSTTFSIIRDNGGFIKLYSEPGKGTKFEIYWVALTSLEFTKDVSITQSQLPRGNGELILVVDDEESILDITRRALERYGYRVMLASHGGEGLSQFLAHRKEIAVILTDMSMPVMDGPSMITELRAVDPNVRIIGSSGLAANGNYAKAFGAGVNHFIPKPYTSEALLTKLRDILSSPDNITEAGQAAVVEPPRQSPPPEEKVAAPAPKKVNTILLVEDDEIFRELVARVIESEGYKVITTAYAKEAQELYAKNRDVVDVVITDMHLPEVTGKELAKVIRGIEEGSNTPIIMLASGLTEAERQRCVEAGVNDFLRKPAAVADLKGILKKWTNPPETQEVSRAEAEEPKKDATPVLDVRVLQDMVDTDADVVEEFLSSFLQSAQTGNLEIRSALAAGNCKGTAAIAHRIKSAAKSIGAAALGACYQQIETYGLHGDRREIELLLSDLEKRMVEVINAVAESMEKH